MHLSIIIFATSSVLVTVASRLDTAYQWKYIDYVWPSKVTKQEAIRHKAYNFSRSIPMDVAVSQDGRVFITVIGGEAPARLAVVSDKKAPSGPLLQPYPSWDWTDLGKDKHNCHAIIKPYRIEIDKCNRLWVIDSASLGLKFPRKCHPKLLAFDLRTDTLIKKIDIPENIAANAKTNQSLLTNVRVETHGQFCEDTTVYMTDSTGNGLVIWDGIQLFRVEDPTFEGQPEASNITVGKYSLQMSTGILGMDISPRVFPNEPQYLYFRPLSSYGLFAARTDQLKRSVYGERIEIVGANDVFSSQTIGHAFSSQGTLFLGLTKEISLVCWNRYRQLNKLNLVTVAQDNERLQYLNAIKVIPENAFREEEVWMLSNHLARYDLGNAWNLNEINFRILRSPVKRLIAGTKCELPREVDYQLEAIPYRSR